MTRLLLDESGDNPVPDDYRLVTDEVSFLRGILAHARLQVRGEQLCAWAAAVATARGWQYTRLQSPASELRAACPQLSEAQAQHFIAALQPQLAELARPLSLRDVAGRRWPATGLWGQQPGPLHAFHWLEWLAQATLSPSEAILVRAVASQWAAEVPDLEYGYSAGSPEQAWTRLLEWLRAVPTSVNWPLWPATPLPPWLLQRLRRHWAVPSVEQPETFFDDLFRLGAQREVLRIAADLVAAYFRHHPHVLTRERLERLEAYLSVEMATELRGLVIPEDPGEAPETIDAAVDWFTHRYLPFREWEIQRGSTEHHRRLEAIARAFGERYLSLYAQACVGGPGADHLSWRRVASLASSNDALTLLVVLDGLGYRDAQQLWEFIGQRSQRLALDGLEVALAPLPTITQFAKQALQNGLPPGLAVEVESPNSFERRDESVIAALSTAKPGQPVIWSLLEPDRTYHQHQSRETAFSQVRGQLQSLAERIVRVAHAIPEERRLRVIIATDHGRLLGSAERCVPVPSGMQAHGRAAWGNVSRGFGEQGYLIEGDLAYLAPSRFGLPNTVAILLSGTAFLTASGATGTEPFPHGGAYPEETLIPWLVLNRDRHTDPLAARLAGKAMAGASGQAVLSVVNPNDVTVQLQDLELTSLNLRLNLRQQRVRAKAKEEIGVPVAPWPEPKEVQAALGRLRYTLPAGDIIEVDVQIDLESEELYSRDDILSDLGEL